MRTSIWLVDPDVWISWTTGKQIGIWSSDEAGTAIHTSFSIIETIQLLHLQIELRTHNCVYIYITHLDKHNYMYTCITTCTPVHLCTPELIMPEKWQTRSLRFTSLNASIMLNSIYSSFSKLVGVIHPLLQMERTTGLKQKNLLL